MSEKIIYDVLINYLCFIPLLTFHEFGHAWMAWKCGDDTAKLQGRVSLNPIVHMELIGTVVLPLTAMFLGAAGSGLASFIIGWGKPVPVNLANLRNPRVDDVWVALAGPAMNFILAVLLVGIVKIVLLVGGGTSIDDVLLRSTYLSLMLCFFNLLPIPPLDGSHVVKNIIGMSHETYWRLCQYGFIMVIIALQIPFIQRLLRTTVDLNFGLIANMFKLG